MAEEATQDTPEMTEAEAGDMALNDLTGGSNEEETTEDSNDSTEEETTTEETTDEADTDEGNEEETQEEVVSDNSALSDLKAQAGRVPSLQKKAAQNENEIGKLNETVKQLREMLTPQKQEEAEGLIDTLTSDDGEAKLREMIRKEAAEMYGGEIEQQRASRERVDYMQRLQSLSGDDWATVEPAATQVLQEVIQGKENGEQWATEIMSAIEASPMTLKLLAEKQISKSVQGQAKVQSEKRKATAQKASGKVTSTPTPIGETTKKDIMNMAPGDAEKAVRDLLQGDAGIDLIRDGL